MSKKFLLVSVLVCVSLFVQQNFILLANAASPFAVSVRGAAQATAGAADTLTASVTNDGGWIGSAVVDVEVRDAAGSQTFQQFFAGQNFNAGETRSYSVAWTPVVSGAYTVDVGVFSQGWSSLYYWKEAGLTVNVGATGSSASVDASFSAWASPSPTNPSVGQPVNIPFQVKDTNAAVAGAITDLEIYNTGGAKVFQQYFAGQNFAAGQDLPYLATWTPSAAGTYTVKIGVFAANWSRAIAWFDDAATIAAGGTGSVSVTVKVPQAAPSPTPSSSPVPTALSGSDLVKAAPLSSTPFYVDPNTPAAASAAQLAASGDTANAHRLSVIASEPQGMWFGGWNANVEQDVNALVSAAAALGKTPLLVAYNIPDRDCGGYSAGGAQTAAAYDAWINSFAQGIGNRSAVVILEPDGLANVSCLSSADQATRESLLSYAVAKLKSLGNTKVYLDAGNSNWISATDMAPRLKAAGITEADGFALNVSNFYTTSENEAYGAALSALVGGKHYVIDTSRNGNGSNGGQWCNPSGMALGALPTTNTGNSTVDALLWVKPPGESDGTCNGGPSAGTWWLQYAEGLARAAGY